MKSTDNSVSTHPPQRVPAWQVKTAIGLVLIPVVVNALRVAFHFGYNRASFDILDGNHAACCDSFIDEFLILIAFALIISAAGMWTRSKKGWIASLVALLLAIVGYYGWYLSTRSIMRKSDVETFARLPNQTQQLLTLIDATWWDVITLAIIVLLILWHLTTFKSLGFARRRSGGSDSSRPPRQFGAITFRS